MLHLVMSSTHIKSKNINTLPQSLHMEQTVVDISNALNKFLHKKKPEEFGMYILQISNLPNLLHNFKDEEVYHYIEKLIRFLFDHFSSKNDQDLLIQPCGLHNIMICTKEKNVKHMLSKIEMFFHKFQRYAMHKNWRLHFVLNCGISHLSHSMNEAIAWEKAMIALAESVSKNTGYNIRIYDPEAHEFIKYKNNIRMATYFRNAFASGDVDLAYQPIFCTKRKKVVSYECLMRLKTEDGDFLSAGPFIKIAERFGFINAVDTFVLEKVVKILSENKNVYFAINVSNLTSLNSAWQKKAKKLITSDIGKRLTIEITETGEMRDLQIMEEFADFIRSLGCKVSVDDFGIGNTSFAAVKIIRPDIIKIDGSFIRDIDTNPESRYFVSAIVKLAKDIGAKTVAEYVENPEIANVINILDVDFIQGNYISQSLNYQPWML